MPAGEEDKKAPAKPPAAKKDTIKVHIPDEEDGDGPKRGGESHDLKNVVECPKKDLMAGYFAR